VLAAAGHRNEPQIANLRALALAVARMEDALFSPTLLSSELADASDLRRQLVEGAVSTLTHTDAFTPT
jgi:hypothetical protein